MDDSNQLKKQLGSVSLSLKEVEGDGNCLFRALADTLYGNADSHGACRQAAVSNIVNNPSSYSPFLEKGTSIAQYTQRMRRNGVYGGNMEIVAFSREMGVDICVHQAGQPVWTVLCDPNSRAKRVLHIVYHSWEHYSSTTGTCSIDDSIYDTGGKPRWHRNPDEAVSKLEQMVMNQTGIDDLQRVRKLFIKFKGDPNRVLDALYDAPPSPEPLPVVAQEPLPVVAQEPLPVVAQDTVKKHVSARDKKRMAKKAQKERSLLKKREALASQSSTELIDGIKSIRI